MGGYFHQLQEESDFVLNFFKLLSVVFCWYHWIIFYLQKRILVDSIVRAHTVWSSPESFSVVFLISSSSVQIGWVCSFAFWRSSYNYFLLMNVVWSDKFVSVLAFNVSSLFNRVSFWFWQWDMYNCCVKNVFIISNTSLQVYIWIKRNKM